MNEVKSAMSFAGTSRKAAGSRRPGAFAGAAVIIVVTLLAFIPAMRAGFVWDDDDFLTRNPLIHAPDGLYRFWFTTEAPDYFPLVSSTLWVEWRLWGEHPSGYHMINILLHAGSAVLIWRVLKRIGVPGAWLAAVLFAVHPVTVQSVAWITERKNTLSMFLYASTILLYLRFESHSTPRAYLPALGCFLLAVLSKTSVVMLPCVLLLLAWWQRGSVTRRDLKRSIPFFVVSAAGGLLTVWFQYHRAIGEELVRTDSLAARVAGAGWAIWFYLYKALVPVGLSPVYPRWRIDPAAVRSWVPLAILAACFAALWHYRRWWGRGPFAGIAYFVLTLLPVLGLANIYFMRYSLVSDHWQYLALVGPVALVAAGVAHVRASLPRQMVAAGVVLLLGLLTRRQCAIYHDQETLWRDTLSKNKGCWLAHNNLGVLLASRGALKAARRHYESAVTIQPDYAEAHANLGLVLAHQGQPQEAAFHYAAALRLKPSHVPAHFNYGILLEQQQEFITAAGEYSEAIKLAPKLPDVHYRLGNIHLRQGRIEDALNCFYAEVKVNPQHAAAHNSIGNLLAQRDRWDEACGHYRQALRFQPDCPEAHWNLAKALCRCNQPEEAIEQFSRGLRLRPDADMHVLLAQLLARGTRLDEAASHYQAAVALSPELAEAHGGLGEVFSAQGKADDAIVQYREALRLKPDWPGVANNLCWLLATHPDPARRRPEEAARRAEGLCRTTGQANAGYLDTLAAAYAALGRFEDAVNTARRAAELAKSAGDSQTAEGILERLRFYEAGQACCNPK